jgi:hypothetical protein
MKKSEVVEYIVQLLAREGINQTFNLTQEEMAQEIISTLEGAGMKPPHHPDRYGSAWCNATNWDDEVYEWESENET